MITGYKKKCKYTSKDGTCIDRNGKQVSEQNLDEGTYLF